MLIINLGVGQWTIHFSNDKKFPPMAVDTHVPQYRRKMCKKVPLEKVLLWQLKIPLNFYLLDVRSIHVKLHALKGTINYAVSYLILIAHSRDHENLNILVVRETFPFINPMRKAWGLQKKLRIQFLSTKMNVHDADH